MIPRHVGFIMDGNGRWATSRGLPRSAGYKAGQEAMERVAKRAAELGVEAVTVYAYSTENTARPEAETAAILSVVCNWNDNYRGDMRVTYMGNVDLLGERVAKSVRTVEERTAENTGMRFNIALGYGGREDIINAAKACCKAGDLSREGFESRLSSAHLPPLDLIVRSGGEKRLSGFMLYEAAYAELIFTDKLWPYFDESDVDSALSEFAARTRKFGK